MTWLKLSDDFADDAARVGLSDAAFRTHVEGLLWTMRRETDGWLDDVDVRKAIETPNAPAAITQLVDVGYWRREGHGYRIVHHMEHQPESDVLAARRKNTAERVNRHRRKRAGLEPDRPPM